MYFDFYNIRQNELKKIFIEKFQNIINKICYNVWFSLGSIIFLEIGEKTIYNPPLLLINDRLSIWGEYHFKVVEGWKILKDGKLYCSVFYDDDNSYTILENKIKILEGKRIKDVYFDTETMNFGIEFEDNLTFIVSAFVGHEDYFEDDINFEHELYTFMTMNEYLEMNPFGTISYYTRAPWIYLKDYKDKDKFDQNL